MSGTKRARGRGDVGVGGSEFNGNTKKPARVRFKLGRRSGRMSRRRSNLVVGGAA